MSDQVGPTDMAPPRPVPKSMVVMVRTDGVHARITTKDGDVDLFVPAAMVLKRMRPGEATAFFRATSEHEVVELGDRVASW